MPVATITSKGQVTIPLVVRKDMDLQPGSKLEFIPDADGTWRVLKRKRSLVEFAGIVKWADEPVSIDEMNEKAKRHVNAGFSKSA